MKCSPRSFVRGGLTVVVASIAAQAVLAQGFISEGEVLVFSTGDIAPGLAPIEIGGGFPLDNPVINENDVIALRVRLVDASITTNIDNRAYVYGTSRDNLQLLVRAGGPAPGLPGYTLNSASSAGIGSALRLSADGLVFFGSAITGPGVLTSNDSAFFGGPLSAPTLWVREGDAAPGTVGAVFSSSFGSFSHQSTGLTDSGRLLFRSSLTGGDTVTENSEGWFSGFAGALELVQRRGELYGDGSALGTLGFVSEMNSSGAILLDGTLSSTLGTTPATAANDKAAWIYTPGSGLTRIVREGELAPGTAGATFNSPTNSWSFNTGPNTFNEAGQWVANLQLQGGDVILDLNDFAIYLGDGATMSPIVRKGDFATGTPGFFTSFNNSSLSLGESAVAFQGAISDGDVTINTGNDTGLWYYDGGLTLLAREGDPIPGATGRVYGSLNGLSLMMNAAGQVIFLCSAVDPTMTLTTNSSQVMCYDPQLGVRPLLLKEDPIEVNPGVFEMASSGSFISNTSNAGSACGLSSSGDYVLNVTMVSGERAIVRGNLGTLSGAPHTLSIAGAPESHTMNLHAGAANAGNIYAIVGSVSGTAPGIPSPPVLVPLNFDAYLAFTINFANTSILQNTIGLLDGAGNATAAFNLPAGAKPSLAGVQFWHAGLVLNSINGQPTLATNPATFTLLP